MSEKIRQSGDDRLKRRRPNVNLMMVTKLAAARMTIKQSKQGERSDSVGLVPQC